MSKFAHLPAAVTATSPLASKTKTALTAEGGEGHRRKVKTELFMLAVTSMVGDDTFYEGAADRDLRLRDLVGAVTRKDPDWVCRFVPFLRGEMNMRSASIVVAAESVKVRLDERIEAPTSVRSLVAAACQRPDEPGEFLAYWRSRFGRNVPSGVKRGLSDAMGRLFTERAALKYDGGGRPWRLGDVIDVVHPTPTKAWQSDLFKYLLDKRHHPDEVTIPESLAMISAHAKVLALPVEARTDAVLLAEGGFTWEEISGWGPMSAPRWESIIPSMGYMALLRNLRNFDAAGVSDLVASGVAARLCDADQVARSRQFPIRFLSAYRNAPSLRWAWGLEQAINASLGNVPSLPGRTLVMVDKSGSMGDKLSARSTVNRMDAALTFGAALALRAADADLVVYDNMPYLAQVDRGTSLLKIVGGCRPSGGTETARCLQMCFNNHDRVILLTDEQHFGGYRGDPAAVIPDHVPLYTFSLAGYTVGMAGGKPNRHLFAGLTDTAFKMLPLLERDESTDWPF